MGFLQVGLGSREDHAMAGRGQGQAAASADPVGARESNAGDEFHLLWALRRALLMLSPSSDLKAIRLEGVSPLDQAATQSERLQGVDLTEYYGGRDFVSAGRVILSQLKYSQRHPRKSWTAARLAAEGRRGRPSVIRRLAEAFETFHEEGGRERILASLEIRLVSNQPIQPKLARTMDRVRDRLGGHPSALDARRLLKSLPVGEAEELGRLYAASGLASRRFTDFLRVFELGHLGVGERFEQEASVAGALGAHLLEETATAGRELFDLVRREALPEASGSLGLNREDLLARLKVSGEDALFPMPSRIAVPSRVIETPDQRALHEAVASREEGWVIAHGDAGVGKTTTVASLEGSLPEGSVVVTYDCFGGGEYLSPKETRHRAEQALLEMINETALRCGSALLLQPPRQTHLLWRRFTAVLEEAAATVAGLGGRFVLAIDAVDNALVAGRELKERSFVEDLLRIDPPPGVVLLLSCRTHRMGDLEIDAPVHRVELRGFDEAASSKNLRRRFGAAPEEVCRQFHERSGGNPRSQFYLLDTEGADQVATAQQAAERAHRTPDAYFDDLLAEAIGLNGDTEAGLKRVAELICLTRPVAIESLAGVAHTDLDSARRFCRALVPGVRLGEEDTVEFRDEDFEVFLRTKVTDEEAREANARIGDYLWARRDDHADAAAQVAQHLALSGRREELMALALEEGQPGVIGDPVARLQIYLRRLRLAMEVAEDEAHREQAFRLALLAAQAARTDQAVTTIVRSQPGLAMRYGDRLAVSEIYESSDQQPWRGPMHLRAAAVDAERGDRRGAEEQLRLAEAWLRIWSSRGENERYQWEISAEDVAAGAYAVYILGGSEAALTEVRRWRPLGFVMEVATALVRRIAKLESGTRVCNRLARLALPAVIEARLQAALFADGHRVPAGHMRRAAAAMLEDPPKGERLREEWTIDFLELMAYTDPTSFEEALESMGPAPPEQVPFDGGIGGWGPALRLHALRAAAGGWDPEPEDLLPVELRADPDEDPEDRPREERRQGRRREAMKVFTRFLPVHQLRARGLVDRLSAAALSDLVEPELRRYEEASEHQWYEGDHTYRPWAGIVAEAFSRSPRGNGSALLDRIADQAPRVTAFSGAAVWRTLGSALMRRERYRDLAYRLLDRAAVAIEGSEEPAPDKADRLLELVTILEGSEESLALDYYDRAVRAAEGLDWEGAGVLSVNAALAGRARETGHARDAATAERLARSVERFQPFVGDTEVLPWAQTAGAVACLDPAAGLALMSRWEEENLCPLSWSLSPVLAACQKSGFLSAEECLALLGLAGEDNYPTSAAVDFLDALRSDQPKRVEAALASLSDFVGRQLLPPARLSAARGLDGWITEHGLESSAGGRELNALARFSEQLSSEDSATTSPYPTWAPRSGRRDSRRRLVESAKGKVEEIGRGLSDLNDSYARDPEIEEFLAAVGAQMAPQDRIAALQALGDAGEDGWLWRSHGAVLLHAMGRWIAEWQRSGAIRTWSRTDLPALVRAHFLALVAYEESAEQSIAAILALPCIEDPAGLVIEALGPNLPELGARQLHAIALGLVGTLNAGQGAAVLDWSLGVLEDGEGPQAPAVPEKAPDALALLLFALFGNPDKRLRWRGAHAGRALLTISGEPLGAALVERLHSREAGPFAAAGETFLWMSAQQWLLVLLARVAEESPTTLQPYLECFTRFALEEDWPHAPTRELARRAALRLDAHSGSLPTEKREELQACGRPRACRAERGHSFVGGHGTEYEGEFRFDAMDTLPYWFPRVARVFGIDPAEVATRASVWIVEKLGFTEERVKELREPRDRRYEYEDTSNRQGSHPRVETLRLYLEYHSMLLTAGQLIDEGTPILWEDYIDAEDPWRSWLAQHLDASPGWWSVDLRSRVPLVPGSYGILGPLSGWRDLSSEDFDRELGLTEESIVVAASTEESNRELYGHAHVSSALVCPESAGALLRALETCRDPWDFGLPDEDGIWPDDSAIAEGEFRLWGWLSERRHHETGLEEQDPLRRISLSFTAPGSRFLAARGLRCERGGRHLVNVDGEEVGATRCWSDQPLYGRGESERGSFSEGWRSTVKLKDLTAFLSDEGADLIIAVRLQRQFARASGMDTEERYDRGKSRIYLLRNDGRIEVVAGRGPARRTDRRRAGSR